MLGEVEVMLVERRWLCRLRLLKHATVYIGSIDRRVYKTWLHEEKK